MPRKPEPSFRVKEIIWDLAATTGAENLSALYRDLDYKLERLRRSKDEDFCEDTPDIRTVRRIIELDINRLPPEVVVAKLPPHVWRLRRDYEEIKRIAKQQPQGKGTPEPPLGFDQSSWASLTHMIESGMLFMVGQNIAAQLAMLEPRVMRSFGCHDIGLKQLRQMLCLYPSRRLDAWVGDIREVESLLQQRKTIQEQVLTDARNGYKTLGSVALIDNNFSLAAYHLLARGNSTWLEGDRFQTLELGALGALTPPIWCPLCDHNVSLQQWDTRHFVCPWHNVPLIPKKGAAPMGIGYAPGTEKELYQELVTPVEDIAVKYPSKAALSMRIPRMLPFSEVVIAVADADSMPKVKSFVRDFLRASPLRQEAQKTEVRLRKSYASLLEALRGAPAAEGKQKS